jgi:spore coat polysaccharide biosynthesis predicted glycosyltransferase SpsG
MRLNAKEITARVENIAIELGGADKAQVIFDA